MTIAKLQSAIREAREAMPPLALALHRADSQTREAYRRYRADMAAWCDRPKGAAYEAYLGGDMPPDVPAALLLVMPPAPPVLAGQDAGEIYRTFTEGR